MSGAIPSYIINNSLWFLYLSNEIEAERMKIDGKRRLDDLQNKNKMLNKLSRFKGKK